MAGSVEMIRFNALRNALYHTARRRQLEWWSRFFNFLVVALGAAAIADFTTSIGFSQILIGVAVSTVGTLQLVMDFAGSARTHQRLQRDYHEVLAEIEEADEPTPHLCRHWEGKLYRIAGDEPPVLRALDAKAYNDAIDASDESLFPRDQRLYIGFWARLAGSFFQFNGTEFKKFCELDSGKQESRVPAE